MGEIEVRDAVPADAARVARMANALAATTGGGRGAMTGEAVRADLIGRPGLGLLVACGAGETAGYALYTAAYETAHAARGLYLSDLYVDAAERRRGLATALLAEIARRAAAGGGRFLWLVALERNGAANALYDRLGATRDPVLARAIHGPAFDRLLDR